MKADARACVDDCARRDRTEDLTMPGEVLIVDGDPDVRSGLVGALRGDGLMATALDDPTGAIVLIGTRRFSIALIELDLPAPIDGPRLIAELRRRSPSTPVIGLASSKVFDLAVAALRAGADDIVFKTPSELPRLRDRMVELMAADRQAPDWRALTIDSLALVDEAVTAHAQTFVAAGGASRELDVLVVGSGAAAAVGTERDRSNWNITALSDADAALDLIGRERFDIVVVEDDLPDLPGGYIVQTIRSQAPDTHVLLLRSGEDPATVTARVDACTTRAVARSRLAEFRQRHGPLLLRLGDLRQRLRRARDYSSTPMYGRLR